MSLFVVVVVAVRGRRRLRRHLRRRRTLSYLLFVISVIPCYSARKLTTRSEIIAESVRRCRDRRGRRHRRRRCRRHPRLRRRRPLGDYLFALPISSSRSSSPTRKKTLANCTTHIAHLLGHLSEAARDGARCPRANNTSARR
eukprot:5093391-Pyramimonas_sp.AAC.1